MKQIAGASAQQLAFHAPTSGRKSEFQSHARRFMISLTLPGCCLNTDNVKRSGQKPFSHSAGDHGTPRVLRSSPREGADASD
jgi:hypothetical protein